MESRQLGRTGRQVGAIGLGCWQVGADWGAVSEQDALATLHAAVDAGVSFLDTADVYGDGRSEQLVGRLLRELHLTPGADFTVRLDLTNASFFDVDSGERLPVAVSEATR